MSFRQAIGSTPEHLDTQTSSNFSNFLFIDKNYASHNVMRRIFSIARKHDYKSILIEKIAEKDSALFAEESHALSLRHSNFQKSEVHRISFFRSSKGHSIQPGDFLGYVIFKWDYFSNLAEPRVHVYESVIASDYQGENANFIHCRKKYEVATHLGKFSIDGVLYAQQNNSTYVCAHVALRTVLASFLPEGDISYSKINQLASIDHKTKLVGSGAGLSPADIEIVLDNLKIQYDKIVHEPSQRLLLPTEYQRHLYGTIESGFPAILGFELNSGRATAPAQRHMIPVFGHAFSEDTWMPQAERAYFGNGVGYFPSENWLSSFLVHDDNFGPYLSLPRHFLKKDNFRIMYGLKNFPTEFNAQDAEAIGVSVLRALASSQPSIGSDWYDRFAIFALNDLLVLRTILIKSNDYVTHLQRAASIDGMRLDEQQILDFTKDMPGYFWIVEASASELFNNSRRKFGEVLIYADRQAPRPLDDTIILGLRLPGLLMFRSHSASLDPLEVQLKGHTELFQFHSV